jgi:hypothetical protein
MVQYREHNSPPLVLVLCNTATNSFFKSIPASHKARRAAEAQRNDNVQREDSGTCNKAYVFIVYDGDDDGDDDNDEEEDGCFKQSIST